MTDLVPPLDCDPDDLPLPRDQRGDLSPYVVQGFKASLGVPRHSVADNDFITDALKQVAERHGNLLELVVDVSDEVSFAALHLLHVCGVIRFGHILSDAPPELASLCSEQCNEVITEVLAVVQGRPADSATTTHNLSVAAGGAGLPFLQRTALAIYLGAFFRVAGPIIHRLA